MNPTIVTGLAVLSASLAALAAVSAAIVLVNLRQRRREVREIVASIEDLRSGKMKRRVDLDARSQLSLVADALNRLGQEMGARLTAAEHADAGLRAMLEAARDYAVVVADADWDVRTFGAEAATLFGWDPDGIEGSSLASLFEDASWAALLPKLARRNVRERGIEGRYTLRRRDGTVFPGRVQVRPATRAGGEPVGFVVVVQDVSAEVRLEAELRGSEARHRDLVEGLPAPVAVLHEGLVAFANPAFGALVGLGAGETAGMRLRDRVATTDVLVFQAALDRLRDAPEGATEEVRLALAGPDGRLAARTRAALTATRRDGEAVVVAVLVDDTAETRVAEELRRNERRLDTVLESAAEGVLVLEESPAGGVVRMTNSAFCRQMGVGRSAILGATERELLATLHAAGGPATRVARLLAAAGREEAHERVPTGEAEDAPVLEVHVNPARGGGGKGKLVFVRDVSQSRAAERGLAAGLEELRRGKEELEAAYRELVGEHEELVRREQDVRTLNDELRTLDEKKTQLLANLSHELQTPLVAIRGYTEMILKGRLGPVNEEQRKGLGLSLRNIDRLVGLIEDLLTLARMDREAESLRFSEFPVDGIVEEAVELLREGIRAKRLTVAPAIEGPALTIRADRDKILQVFLNLLTNAVKFNREGGRIEVEIRRAEPRFAVVKVTDTGVGIPEAELERIFERFYQASSAGESARQGTGIGLAIVRDILRLHGCVIRVESRVGEGTTFTFTLPLAPGATGRGTGDEGGERGAPRTDASPPADERTGPVASQTPPERRRFRIIRR